MDDLQAQMRAILNDPNMMQTIMGLAQGMSQSQPQTEEAPKQAPSAIDGIDLGMLQKLASYAQQSSIDQNQKNLLNALSPYISRERVGKLERAMRAAKLAHLTTGIFGGGR